MDGTAPMESRQQMITYYDDYVPVIFELTNKHTRSVRAARSTQKKVIVYKK